MAIKYKSCKIDKTDLNRLMDNQNDTMFINCSNAEEGQSFVEDFNKIFKNSDWVAFAHHSGYVDISRIRFRSRNKVIEYVNKKISK